MDLDLGSVLEIWYESHMWDRLATRQEDGLLFS